MASPERVGRGLGLGEGRDLEKARLALRDEVAAGAVGEAALAADLLIQAGAGVAAEHGVVDLGGEQGWIAVGDPHLAEADLGLDGIRLVDHHHPRPGGGLHVDPRQLAGGALLPAAEGALGAGEGVGRLDVPDDREDRLVGDEVRLMEGRQVGAAEAGERLRGAAGRPAVGVGAEDQAIDGGGGQIGRALLIDLQAAQGLPAPALELILWEGGVEDDVGEQVEPQAELVGGHGDVGVTGLGARVGREITAHEIDCLGDLLRRAGGGPLGQQRGRGLGEARLAVRLVGLAGVEHHADGDQRLLVLLDDDDQQAVVQRLLLEGREAHFPGRARRGRRRRGLGHRFRVRLRGLRQARRDGREQQARGGEGLY